MVYGEVSANCEKEAGIYEKSKNLIIDIYLGVKGGDKLDCIFCKIANGEIPSTFIYEDEQVVAFPDISPAAPVHVLVIPKKHIANLLEVTADDAALIAHIMAKVIPQIAKEHDLTENGFRLVVNTKEDGGQTVNHLHFHLLGGRSMTWPPG